MVTKDTVDTQLETADGSTNGKEGTLTTEATPDLATLQAQLKEKDEALAKLNNDLKAQQGRNRSTEITDRLDDLQAEVKGQRKLVAAYLDAMQSGDTDALPAKVTQIEAETTKGQAERASGVRYQRAVDRMMEVVEDSEGRLLLTEEQSATISKAWQEVLPEYYRTGDLSLLTDISLDASKMVAGNQRDQRAAEIKKVRDEEKQNTKQRLAKAGVADLDIGPAAGGGAGVTTWAQAQKVKKMSDLPSGPAWDKLIAGG